MTTGDTNNIDMRMREEIKFNPDCLKKEIVFGPIEGLNYPSQRELDELELAELRQIVAQLPHTEDGKPIIPFVTKVYGYIELGNTPDGDSTYGFVEAILYCKFPEDVYYILYARNTEDSANNNFDIACYSYEAKWYSTLELAKEAYKS